MDATSPERDRTAGPGDLRQLRLVGVGLPALFIVLVQLLRPVVFDRYWPRDGDTIVSVLTALAAIAFGLMMFRLIEQLVEDDRYRSTVAERDRIARELHDSLPQVLGATQLRLQAAAYHPAVREHPDLEQELGDIAQDCQDAYRDVREAILGLREGTRTDHTFLQGLQTYADKYSRQSGIDTTVEADLPGEPTLTPHREVQVIRVIQEALTNARKHSGARRARIRVSETADWATFVVEDDGQGFVVADPAGGREGFGLHSMRERTELVGGRLTVRSAPGLGTTITIMVPRGQRGSRLPMVMPV
ncbi:sensor histidine kinase [Arsenicicoccus sp. oral taxon 190]|uniref:sensor histidine kinase n=1 Tax=Arsenicicoccus sp. oral taxon 190 TaxID=1658671 RepID=UPI00067ACFB6|nr:sensor histidine kinase [Arsenicicoccus sp. oral taxon 190]